MDYRIGCMPLQGPYARLQGHTIQERRRRGVGTPKSDDAKKDVLGDNTLGYIFLSKRYKYIMLLYNKE